MTGKTHDDMIFFKNISGKIEHNNICKDCSNACKQSFKAQVITCPKLKEGVDSDEEE